MTNRAFPNLDVFQIHGLSVKKVFPRALYPDKHPPLSLAAQFSPPLQLHQGFTNPCRWMEGLRPCSPPRLAVSVCAGGKV
jgi:hypothetical protein